MLGVWWWWWWWWVVGWLGGWVGDSGDSLVIIAPDSPLIESRGFESVPAGAAGESVSSPWSTFCADSYFGIGPFHPRVTAAVARKRPRSFCQKHRSVAGYTRISTHTPYVCDFAWSDMVHGCMVYTERAEMAAVQFLWHQPYQRCNLHHVVRWSQKTRYKKLFTHVESHASAVSLLESGE